MRGARLAVLVAVASAVLPRAPALAQEDPARVKDACADAYEQAQRARKRGQLRASRRELLRCTRPACPAVLSSDCAVWLREIEGALPTMVAVVKDEGGRDVVEARVYVDGELARGEGGAIELDPGPHHVRVTAAGHEAGEQEIVLHEGERLRRVVVTLRVTDVDATRSAGGVVTGGGAAPGAGAASEARHRAFTSPVVILGSVSAAALGGFIGFGARGLVQKSELVACRPNCNPRDVDATRASFLVADVFLGASAVALGVGAYLYFRGAPARVVAYPGGAGLEASF